MRDTIEVCGAREHNLRDISVELPRMKLIVVTGVSGSGKSSLAFDTIYAEAQRRLMDSMSAFAKRFVNQLKKPDVDFIHGLSPVISIDQKTVTKNPRSTVGTMTDIWDYLRMLYATVGVPSCPYCARPLRMLSPAQMSEHLLALPPGCEVEVRAPIFKFYGEDYNHLFDQVRTNGYRRVRIDGELVDIGDAFELDEESTPRIEAVIDRFVVAPGIDKEIRASLEHGAKLGEGFLSFHVLDSKPSRKQLAVFYRDFGCAEHHVVSRTLHHGDFTFNDPAGACPTCLGLGDYMRVHVDLLVPDKSRSLADGAIVKEAFNNDKNSWGGRILYSLAAHYGFDLETPFQQLDAAAVDVVLRGTAGDKIPIVVPEAARQGQQHAGRELRFQGVIAQIEHQYHSYRRKGESNAWMEDYLKKVMVEHDCPDCGGTRLKRARRLVTVDGKSIYDVGEMHLRDAIAFLDGVRFDDRHDEVGRTLRREIGGRLQLLVDIGLDYLNLNRRSATLSGGESQRIRLSSQIGSGLMGMLYVLDEPSIGLHPRDNSLMIATLRRLRDLGNSVIVVEHDEDTIRAADHVLEVGPGPGVHGGRVVANGTLEHILCCDGSPTGQFLSGTRAIEVPKARRKLKGRELVVRGARHNNLDGIDVTIPLGALTCVTGVSGSGKSSLIHDVLYKKLYALKVDSRVLPGEHDGLDGHELVDEVIDIDQSPIGRSPRSNPATYVGFYDNIRKLFASTPEAAERGYTAARFSFNVKGGRCEECSGEGTITTRLSFMPDIEVQCPMCKGKRYNDATLDVTYRGKSIADVLELSIEDGVEFFAGERLIARKLGVLAELGLGYLSLGHPATILSGGEAQRVKLASELGKVKRGRHNLYILDEPTTGLHFADIQRLLDSFDRLIAAGHSVVVIEHNLDVIKTADWVIDLGPEGGHKGGRMLVAGRPEEVAMSAASHTGKALAPLLARSSKGRRR